MRHVAMWGLAALATLSLAVGCTRRAVPPATGNANTNAAEEGMKKQEEDAMVKTKAVVELQGLRDKALAGKPLEVTWQVKSDGGVKTITHTAVHYDTTSHPGDLGTDIGPSAAGYKELTPDYAAGEYQVPRAFTVRLTPQAGTLYLRAHAIIEGKNYWTAEESIEVVSDPKMMGEGEGVMKKKEEGVKQQQEDGAVMEKKDERVMKAAPTVKTFNLTAKQWEFSPSRLTVKKGDRVRVTIINLDVAHGFGIPALGVDQPIAPGQTVTVEFTADKVGEFPFRCTVPCGLGHRNMTGALVVQE